MSSAHFPYREVRPFLLSVEDQMSEYIVLYNPAAQKDRGLENAKKVEKTVHGGCRYQDMTEPGFSVSDFVKTADPGAKIVITGGDGTLNYFLNSLPDENPNRGLYYFPGGSGNDFIRDLNVSADSGPILLNPYIENLPVVEAGGKSFRFLNGVGVGLDGYCCERKEDLKEKGKEQSYTRIAIEGVLHRYRPCDAEITVDGETKKYRKVWMAPTMFGRYFGGGVMAAPRQDRSDPSHMMTSVVVHDSGRIWALIMFLLFCEGKGRLFPRHIEFRRGYEIHMKISAPAAIQVDGETIREQTEYRAVSARP